MKSNSAKVITVRRFNDNSWRNHLHWAARHPVGIPSEDISLPPLVKIHQFTLERSSSRGQMSVKGVYGDIQNTHCQIIWDKDKEWLKSWPPGPSFTTVGKGQKHTESFCFFQPFFKKKKVWNVPQSPPGGTAACLWGHHWGSASSSAPAHSHSPAARSPLASPSENRRNKLLLEHLVMHLVKGTFCLTDIAGILLSYVSNLLCERLSGERTIFYS